MTFLIRSLQGFTFLLIQAKLLKMPLTLCWLYSICHLSLSIPSIPWLALCSGGLAQWLLVWTMGRSSKRLKWGRREAMFFLLGPSLFRATPRLHPLADWSLLQSLTGPFPRSRVNGLPPVDTHWCLHISCWISHHFHSFLTWPTWILFPARTIGYNWHKCHLKVILSHSFWPLLIPRTSGKLFYLLYPKSKVYDSDCTSDLLVKNVLKYHCLGPTLRESDSTDSGGKETYGHTPGRVYAHCQPLAVRRQHWARTLLVWSLPGDSNKQPGLRATGLNYCTSCHFT